MTLVTPPVATTRRQQEIDSGLGSAQRSWLRAGMISRVKQHTVAGSFPPNLFTHASSDTLALSLQRQFGLMSTTKQGNQKPSIMGPTAPKIHSSPAHALAALPGNDCGSRSHHDQDPRTQNEQGSISDTRLPRLTIALTGSRSARGLRCCAGVKACAPRTAYVHCDYMKAPAGKR